MRKFAIVPAIVAGILFLNANGALAGGTSNTIGAYTYYNFNGVTGSSNTIGAYTYYNFNGVTGSSNTIGNYTYFNGSLFGD